MSIPLTDLFENGSDSQLTGDLVNRIFAAHPNGVDVSKLREEEQVVMCVYMSHGVIGNGGFRYLFEHNPEGDPDFALTLHAFEVIGCWEAADALRGSLAAFPGSRPPSNMEKRLKQYSRHLKNVGWPTPEDHRFFAVMDEVDQRLANYVRARQRAFMHLA